MTPFKIGLTGSIGMGKSTTARMFAAAPDVAVWDADAAVHRLYGLGGAAVEPIGRACSDAVENGAVDRNALKSWIKSDQSALKQIEQIVHPLVAEDRAAFLRSTPAPIAVLDIPLLFETGGDAAMDMTVVVSTDPNTQRARVLDRQGMTLDQLSHILSVQMPDAEKRARADRIIRTDNLESAQQDVDEILNEIREVTNA